ALQEMKKRGWEFMGHGITNSENLAGLNLEKERELIQTVLKTIEQASGQRPRGWLGSGLAETYNTLDILAEEGVIYCGDWNNDDQPYPMKVKKGRMFSIPTAWRSTTSRFSSEKATPANNTFGPWSISSTPSTPIARSSRESWAFRFTR